jgi:hypothetical protein
MGIYVKIKDKTVKIVARYDTTRRYEVLTDPYLVIVDAALDMTFLRRSIDKGLLRAYKLILGRTPTAEERAQLLERIRSYRRKAND